MTEEAQGLRAGEVRHNAAARRYELAAGGKTAVADYVRAPGQITFTHTFVPPELRHHGIGARLVEGALEAARKDGLKVVPQCSFVAAFIRRHREFQDLLA